VKRVTTVVVATFVFAVACSSANASAAQGRRRGHLKHAARQAPPSEYRDVVLPAGTTLKVALTSPVASDRSKVEDQVRATVSEPVIVDRHVVLPRGTQVVGYITDIERSGRVKGRARVAIRFNKLVLDGDEYIFRSEPIHLVADATKGEDATKIGIGAGAGAAIGAILDGASGARKGAVLGGAAGTGTVLATRGEEVKLDSGDTLDTRLTRALRVRVPVR
jgi:hypothetical protein